MTPYQYQYYSFLEERRKRAMYNYSLVLNAISVIRRAVEHGIDPRDPDLDQYWKLIDEDMQKLFIEEFENGQYLTLEKDTEDPVH